MYALHHARRIRKAPFATNTDVRQASALSGLIRQQMINFLSPPSGYYAPAAKAKWRTMVFRPNKWELQKKPAKRMPR